LGKQSLYDAAMKAPLVFAGPGIRHGESQALVYLLDIYPTLCELAGIAVPTDIDGRGFRVVLEGKSEKAREALFFSYLGVQRALRDARWKLIRYPRVDVTQLFDLQEDPDEIRDLAADPAHGERLAAMLARLKAAQSEWGDDVPLSVAEPQPRAWRPPAK
jgi:arylsulfatase A-like enzyme